MPITTQPIRPWYKPSPLWPIPQDWEVLELNKIWKIVTWNTPLKSEERYWNWEFLWASATDFTGKYIFDTKQKITKEWTDVARVLPKWSILVTCIASIGLNAIAGKELSTNQQINAIIPNEMKSSEWIYYGIEYLKPKLQALAGKTAVPIVSKWVFEKFKLPLPPLPEQTAIANILSTTDNAIQQTQEIIKKLEVRNKGLGQKLLQNKKWEEKRFWDIFERITRKNAENNTNVVTISAQRWFVRQTDFFNKAIASEILDNYFLVEKWEFCYNKSYSNWYPLWATKRLNDFEKAVVTTLYICFKIKETNQTSWDFFEHFFNANLLDKGLIQIAHEWWRAHWLLNVTPDDFFNLKIKIPETEEQIKIANILDKSTQQLNQYKQKLAKLQTLKKWLMQQLLTGKVRVKEFRK